MRCERCKASYEVHYAESYETDWYCHAGVPEEEMNEDKNGDWGCNLHYKTIQKRVEENEKAWHKDKEQYVDWFLDRQGRSEIHCNCTNEEIAKTFIEDVEAVKDLLPKTESEG